MGAIFIGEAKQFIDLYLNDAFALNKTIKVMQAALEPKDNSN